MFIAMNRFKVLKEECADFEAMWLGRRVAPGEEPRLRRLSHAARTGARGPHPLLLAHCLGDQGLLHGLDHLRALPRRPTVTPAPASA